MIFFQLVCGSGCEWFLEVPVDNGVVEGGCLLRASELYRAANDDICDEWNCPELSATSVNVHVLHLLPEICLSFCLVCLSERIDAPAFV